MQPLIPLLNMFSSPCREITYHPFDAVVAEACHPPNGNSTERKAQGNEQRGGITNISYKELSFEQVLDKMTLNGYLNTVQITHRQCLFVRYGVLKHSVTVTL